MEKISFLYLSEILPGKLARTIHKPQPWLEKKILPANVSFDITFGLILKMHAPYRVDVDVFYDDISLIGKDRQGTSSDPLYAVGTKNLDYASIENMSLLGIKISNYGLHRVVANLYGDPDRDGNYTILHTMESFFFVAEDWA